VLRVSAVAEDAGLPTASLCCSGFVGQAKSSSMGLGYPDLGIATIPGHIDVQSSEELRNNILTVTLDDVIENLTAAKTVTTTRAREPEPYEIVFQGDYREINRYFIENEWSDGLPIVPPTMPNIEEFLSFVDRERDEILGILLPDNRTATIWNVAVNGVMAGCRPEYMPILVAIVEAMADPQYGVEHSSNTPGAEALVILNGPIIKELDFNYEQGALRDGYQANSTIGRFVRLYLRNVAGFLPHRTDKGTFGGTWRVVLAENENALAEMGWPTYAAERGCAPGENAITISRFTGDKVIASVNGDEPEKLLPYLAESLVSASTWECNFTLGTAVNLYRPLLVMTPIIAEKFASGGYSKDDVRRRLFDLARIPASKFENLVRGWTNMLSGTRSLYEHAKLGTGPKVLGLSNDPNRLVPIVGAPDHIQIAVSGDPMRSNCIVLTHNGFCGFPTTKAVKLPDGWHEKLRMSRERG